MANETITQYWRHLSSGEIYAVGITGDVVTAAAGPINRRDAETYTPQQMLDTAQGTAAEDAAWVQADLDAWAYYGRGSGLTPYQQAERRVLDNDELYAYKTVLIAEDWPEGDEHYRWVATAPVDEIVDWALTIARDVERDEAANA